MTEHKIWLIMVSYNGTMLPCCWRLDEQTAKSTRESLQAAAGGLQLFYVFPVSDVPLLYGDDKD